MIRAILGTEGKLLAAPMDANAEDVREVTEEFLANEGAVFYFDDEHALSSCAEQMNVEYDIFE